MEIVGYIASLFIGVSLGLIGAGGSILTVPVMVYLFGVPVLSATSYSLFIVGVTSLAAAVYQALTQNVNGKVALLFSVVSLSLVFLLRRYVIPWIPADLFFVSGKAVTFSLVSLILFSLLMLASARAMIRSTSTEEATTGKEDVNVFALVSCGVLVGLVTGLLGAGGGFILIPAMVLILHLPMKTAIGTSLLIISINSLFGFALDLEHMVMDWRLLSVVTGIAGGGVYLGVVLGKNSSNQNLKRFFGWMVMMIGVAILLKEVSGFVFKR